MLLSVLIPALNEERYLPACLQALREQTLPLDRYEIIVADNNSSDATSEVARAWGARVVREPVKSVARARQRAGDAAQGSILASTDADTLVPPDWLARIACHMARDSDLGAVCGPVYWADARPHEQFIMKHPVTWALRLSNHIGHNWWLGSNFAIRAEVFRQVGGFRGYDPRGLVGEDGYLSWQVSRVAPVLFDPHLAVHTSARRLHEGYLNYLRRAFISLVRVTLLGLPSLPVPDIR
ncbi:MAG TPA: glycosyltransferase family 2 protein [Anaerolineae bacterium]|nr:glycosyltransferase family 2 protein [Anaerolineae bacterium]HOR01596.1 glycosyltransferase family 2 protein [Anaerolineae bacterium]HPL30746.1 glycosyltransferase family 2 protein [Anaerolineae bacterium]